MGVLALQQVQGQLDAQTVRGELDAMLRELRSGLDRHRDTLNERLGEILRGYFDPDDGRFAERVEKLTHADGELASIVRAQVAGDGSALVKTLSEHLGPESRIMRLVDPANAEGLLGRIGGLVAEELRGQSEAILGEFSLDNKNGALARLVDEIVCSHGNAAEGLQKRIDSVVKEFSLDDEGSALSRLVQQVRQAQLQITSEFSLDGEESALARLRREWLDVARQQNEAIGKLTETVTAELRALQARRDESLRSTAHGNDFEAELWRYVSRESERAGDVCTHTGHSTGAIRHCKVGDVVIEIGPEHQAAGSRIVLEAKEDAGYDLGDILAEIDKARRNRNASVGVFVLSERSAGEGVPRFRRYGQDLVVIWDAEDPARDVYLDAALSVARALCQPQGASALSDLDLQALDRAVREVERQIEGLDEVRRSAETIQNGSEKILNRVRIMTRNLRGAVDALDEGARCVRHALGD